eukprot:SAG25_NODE_2114_length_1931_cov_1.799127_2_plen_197_part_00
MHVAQSLAAASGHTTATAVVGQLTQRRAVPRVCVVQDLAAKQVAELGAQAPAGAQRFAGIHVGAEWAASANVDGGGAAGGGGSAELVAQRRQAALAEQQQRKHAGLSRKRNRYAVSDVRSCLSLLQPMRAACSRPRTLARPRFDRRGWGAVQEAEAERIRKLKKGLADRTPVSAVIPLVADARCCPVPSRPRSPTI